MLQTSGYLPGDPGSWEVACEQRSAAQETPGSATPGTLGQLLPARADQWGGSGTPKAVSFSRTYPLVSSATKG